MSNVFDSAEVVFRYTRRMANLRGVRLFIAEPVRAPDGTTRGVLYIARTTYPVLVSLYSVRNALIRVALVSLAVAAVVSLVLGVTISARWEAWLEVLGGVSLLALGCWTLLSRSGALAHVHGGVAHTHDDARPHSHAGLDVAVTPTPGPFAQTLAGALFGMSGVRGLLMLLPLMGRDRAVMLSAGVALFGLGVVLSMFAVGWFAQRVTDAATRWERGLRVPVGVASMLCGAWWVVSHV